MSEKFDTRANPSNGIDAPPDGSPAKSPGAINWEPKRINAAKRLNSILRVGEFRKRRGDALDPYAFARAIARTLGQAPHGEYVEGRRQRFGTWPGLTYSSLMERLGDLGITEIGSGYLFKLISLVERERDQNARSGLSDDIFSALSDAAIGAMIELTAAEREECAVVLIEACDESREERLARATAPRRAAEAARKRARRGRQSRAEYVAQTTANSAKKERPWEALGVSRATYYRTRGK